MALVAVILGNVLMHHGWSFWGPFALLMSAAFAIGLLSSFLWRKRVYRCQFNEQRNTRH